MQKDIHHKWFYNQSAEEVWDYLTKPELIEQWLMKNTFHPVAGSDFQFITKPIPSLDFDGIFHCKVVEIVPLQKLIYSMKCGPGDGTTTLDSMVTWILTSKENGTELDLSHTGFKDPENMPIFNGMNDGWLKNMQKVSSLLNNASHA